MLHCFKKQFVTLCLAMACMAMEAQTVTSPDGQIQVNFSLTASGQPTYAVTYKQGPVVLPSHALSSRDRRLRPSTRRGNLFGANIKTSAITITSCWCVWLSPRQSG